MCEMPTTSDVYKLPVYKNSAKPNKTFFSEVTFYFLKHGGFKASKVFSHLLLEKNRHHKNKGSFHSVWREVFPPLKRRCSLRWKGVSPPLGGKWSLRWKGDFPSVSEAGISSSWEGDISSTEAKIPFTNM